MNACFKIVCGLPGGIGLGSQLQVQGQPRQHSEALSQNEKRTEKDVVQ